MAVKYQEFIEAVAGITGLDHGSARAAAEATLAALARALDGADRDRLLEALPAARSFKRSPSRLATSR